MIPNISSELNWLEKHPDSIIGIIRGIERETLRIDLNGKLSQTDHPAQLGSTLTHPWITTDFAESLLEFITPADTNLTETLSFLKDLHINTIKSLPNEQFWPFSMPCFIGDDEEVRLAQYGNSNIGKLKTLYREGLKQRYGAVMQTISGVHYNFSFPLSFWQAYLGVEDEVTGKDKISSGYLNLIRNYYRFGWVIPFLFGASPAICRSFLNNKQTHLPFEFNDSMAYLPYGTSLRLSDLGYTSNAQTNLGLTFNNIDTYIGQLRHAMTLSSEEFKAIGLEKDGKRIQINTNILQIENELYAPIRPKRVTKANERPSDAILRGGIQYIEVRSLDINPFDAIGISDEQARFLDLFLIWCVLAKAPEMSSSELQCTKRNWQTVIVEGRKPDQTIAVGCGNENHPLRLVGKSLFVDLIRIARILDKNEQNNRYEMVCEKWIRAFDEPELTYSGILLQAFKEQGMTNYGLSLAKKYKEELSQSDYQFLTQMQFDIEKEQSITKQWEIESQDTLSFSEFLRLNGGQ
ncbi:glutamate--cysteine ligase [Thorsellia anophelis]|uniref:Glutamate--cysteine ligase n=1 Tax=Thorsellia anophelis DSM 18579 TaxID=1123402 RepID=A0A1H9YPA7_9GAMM|nr:glutamate--cysteine ligase [Thorsellia anophelis]SES70924.1 glutamate-cysteine ligase [Thorsellia anophelis DSM 18579]